MVLKGDYMKIRFDYSGQLEKAVDYFMGANSNENDVEIKSLKIDEKAQNKEFNRQKVIDFKDAFLNMRTIAQINGDILEYSYDEEIKRGELKYLCGNLMLNVNAHAALFDCLKSAASVDVYITKDLITIVIVFNFNI